ncbi:MAG: threonine synthase [Actinomycetota bacterium]
MSGAPASPRVLKETEEVEHVSATTVAEGSAAAFGVAGLSCRECGQTYPVSPLHACDRCFGPLQVLYDYERLAGEVRRADVEAGPASIWRYAPLLPAPERGRVDIGAGWTPLRPAPRLAAELGLKKLWLKNDAANPTSSFKDRVVSVALSAGRYFGCDTVACASTGNLANAVAAHAAATGLRSVVLIPKGLEAGKVAGTAVYGGLLLEVEGSYDDCNRLCAELAGATSWAFVNVSLRPFYAEGSKTVGFEIAEQLGWRAPDAVVSPVASGSLLSKVARSFEELGLIGLIEPRRPRMFGAQAAGCAPVAAAFERGDTDVRPVKPATIAKSLGIGDPADGPYALAAARGSGGRIDAVPEESVAEGMRLLARTEGIFTETAGGVTIAALERLVARGDIAPGDETVALLTGLGYKTVEALGPPPEVAPIDPTIASVQDVLRRKGWL